MINPFTMLGPKTRKTIYMLFGFAVIVAGSIDVWYGDMDPEWLGNLQRVLTYLSAPITVLAAANVPGSPEEIAEVIEDAKHDGDPDRPV